MTARARLAFALSALICAGPLAAQKPAAEDDTVRANYRGHGLALCAADLGGTDGIAAADAEAVCGCAFDRFMPRHWTDDLPALAPGRFQPVMGADLLACAAERRPALAAPVGRRLSAASSAATPAAAEPLPRAGKPEDDGGAGADKPAPAAPDGDGGWQWTNPLPLWAWILLTMLGFALFRAVLRARDPRRDLIAPPSGLGPCPVPPPAPRPPIH